MERFEVMTCLCGGVLCIGVTVAISGGGVIGVVVVAGEEPERWV